jgi:hypothetical protein
MTSSNLTTTPKDNGTQGSNPLAPSQPNPRANGGETRKNWRLCTSPTFVGETANSQIWSQFASSPAFKIGFVLTNSPFRGESALPDENHRFLKIAYNEGRA